MSKALSYLINKTSKKALSFAYHHEDNGCLSNFGFDSFNATEWLSIVILSSLSKTKTDQDDQDQRKAIPICA